MVRKMPEFKTNVVTGPALLSLSENVRGWQKRDCYRQLNAYLYNAECDRVCLLFGLLPAPITGEPLSTALLLSAPTTDEPSPAPPPLLPAPITGEPPGTESAG